MFQLMTWIQWALQTNVSSEVWLPNPSRSAEINDIVEAQLSFIFLKTNIVYVYVFRYLHNENER